MKIVKSSIAWHKTYNTKTGHTKQYSAPICCHQSVEFGKSTTGKIRNASAENFRKLPVANFPHSTFYHRPRRVAVNSSPRVDRLLNCQYFIIISLNISNPNSCFTLAHHPRSGIMNMCEGICLFLKILDLQRSLGRGRQTNELQKSQRRGWLKGNLVSLNCKASCWNLKP